MERAPANLSHGQLEPSNLPMASSALAAVGVIKRDLCTASRLSACTCDALIRGCDARGRGLEGERQQGKESDLGSGGTRGRGALAGYVRAGAVPLGGMRGRPASVTNRKKHRKAEVIRACLDVSGQPRNVPIGSRRRSLSSGQPHQAETAVATQKSPTVRYR